MIRQVQLELNYLVNGMLQHSSPDISFASSDLNLDCSWKVTNETLGSDHLVIQISITIARYESVLKKKEF